MTNIARRSWGRDADEMSNILGVPAESHRGKKVDGQDDTDRPDEAERENIHDREALEFRRHRAAGRLKHEETRQHIRRNHAKDIGDDHGDLEPDEVIEKIAAAEIDRRRYAAGQQKADEFRGHHDCSCKTPALAEAPTSYRVTSLVLDFMRKSARA